MRRKNKKFYIVLILIVLFGVSVGYAAINRVLTITGNSEVKQNTWDIHFENIQVRSGSVDVDLPVIDTETKSTVNFNIMLDLPGDFYEFTVDVVNDGTIDAMIESVTKTPELTAEQAKYLNYIIEYQNGEEILSNQIVLKESFVRIKVRVEYRTDLSETDLPTTFENLTLGFALNYVQANYNIGTVIKYNGIMSVDGDINDIGTIVTIGSEKFYTIGTEGDNVKLLAMYNLYVGGSYNVSNLIEKYGDKATGMQDEKMKGFIVGQTIRNGTLEFSNEEYNGANYNDYSGSLVEFYVNNYKLLLESKFDIKVADARLITKEELISEKIGCSESNTTCKDSPYEWIYSTSYWTQSTYLTYLWYVYSHGFFGNFANYETDYAFGVRPIIIMSKSLF